MNFHRLAPKALNALWRRILAQPPEPRTTDNVPVACPIEPEAMQSYIKYLRTNGLAEVGFDPCIDCEFFRAVRLGPNATEPTRDVEWFDYGMCVAPEREKPVLVNIRPVESRARKVTGDDPEETNDMVLAAIDGGAVTVREVVAQTRLAERSVFKVLARLRHDHVLAPGVPLRRVAEVRTAVKAVRHG